MMKKKFTLSNCIIVIAFGIMATLFIGLTGCTGMNEGMSRKLNDKPKIVTQFSGGKQVGQWTSRGMVHSEESSDGYYFVDSATGKFMLVAGDLQIVDAN